MSQKQKKQSFFSIAKAISQDLQNDIRLLDGDKKNHVKSL
jgi:hypothetical protein